MPLVCFTNTRIAAAAPRAARLEPHQQLPQRLQFFLRTRITNRVGYDVKGFSFPEYTDDKYLLTATVQPGYESAGPTFLLDERIVRHHVIGCTTWPSAEPYLKGELHLEIVVPSTDKVNPSVFPTTMIINAGNQTHRGDSHNEKPVPLQHTMGSNAVTGNELPRINVPCTPKPQRPPPKVRAVFDELSRPATARSGATASGASAVVASDTDAPAGAPPPASPSSTSTEMRVLDIARLPLALRALGADLDSWAGKAALQVAHGWAKLGGDATLDLFEFSQAARELETTKPPILKRDSPRRTSEGGRSWRHGSPYQTGVRERTKLVETIEGKVEGTDAGDRKRLSVALAKQPLQRAPAPRSPEEKEKQQLLQLQLQQSRQQQHPLVPKLGEKLEGGAAEGLDDVRRLEQAGLFVVELEGADGLKAVDMTNTSDPYVVLKLPGHEEWRSSVVPWQLHPRWDESASWPIASRRELVPLVLTLQVWDRNHFAQDKPLGELKVHLGQLADETRMVYDREPFAGEGDGATLTFALVWKPDKTAATPAPPIVPSTPAPRNVPSTISPGSHWEGPVTTRPPPSAIPDPYTPEIAPRVSHVDA